MIIILLLFYLQKIVGYYIIRIQQAEGAIKAKAASMCLLSAEFAEYLWLHFFMNLKVVIKELIGFSI